MQQTRSPTILRQQMLVLKLMLMLMLMLTMATEGLQAKSTCGAATNINSRTTYITCHFEQDISEYGFNVQYLPGNRASTETALACNRMKSGGLYCHMANGVEFDEHQKILQRFTFTRNATLNSVGSQYKCQVVPSSEQDPVEPCSVVEIDIPEVPEPTSPPADTDGSGESPAVITLLVIIIVIVVAVGICVALACVKRKRITSWWTEHTILIARTEENMDTEKNTSQNSSAARSECPQIPQGWLTYFYSMVMAQSRDHRPIPEQEANLGNRGAAAPLLENPVSPGEETGITPGKTDTKKLQKEQKKAEKERVKREKEAAEIKVTITWRKAHIEANRLTEGAKGKSQEEKEKAKSEADRILKHAKEVTKQIKDTAGKGDKEGNQEATTRM